MARESTDRIPATQAALALAISREAVIRRLQRGELEGGVEDGRWYVSRRSLRDKQRTREERLAVAVAGSAG